MGMSRKTAGLLTMFMGMAMAMKGNGWMDDRREQYNELTAEEKELLQKRIKAEKERQRIERLKAKGVQEWIYFKKDDTGNEISVTIYARNKKNADRKANNKGCFVL